MINYIENNFILILDDIEEESDLHILYDKKYEGFDCRIEFKKSIYLDNMFVNTLNKFYEISINFNYAFDLTRELDINLLPIIKQLIGAGIDVHIYKNEEILHDIKNTLYRKLPSAVIIRCDDEIITLDTEKEINLFYKLLTPTPIDRLSSEELDLIDAFKDNNFVIQAGSYVFNLCMRIRKNVISDWM